MPTRKDKTNVAPIYREQVFIPASGATLMKQKARPKFNGVPIANGAIDIVSPEFDLLTGIRGIANLPKGFLKTKGLPKGEELYYRQVARENNPLERAKNIGIIDVKSAPKKDFVTKSGLTFNFGKTFNVPFFSKGDLWYGYNPKYDVIVGKDNPLLDWKTITKGGRVTKPTISNPRRTPYYMEEANQAPTELFELYRHYPGIGYRNVTNGFPTVPITGLNTTAEQMKCGGRRKAQLGLAVTDGGTLTPIAPNIYLAQGRTHDDGGIGISYGKKYNAGGNLEIEDKELLQVVGGNTKFVGNGKYKNGGQEASIRVFSAVPFLRGTSPAQLVMNGANPNKVFKAQEDFKDRNRINDDGTRYQTGGQKKSNSVIRTEKDKKVPAYNRAVYSTVDSTSDYPKWWQAIGLGIGSNIKAIINPDNMNYNVTDSVADAAWRKRLGLSYDNKFLIPNKDGTVRLPKDVEMEIPTDTTMLKRRIAANEQFANQNNIMGEDWKIVQSMIDKDKEALEALRTTYKTEKPVVINEYAHNSRNLSKDGELIKDAINYKSPLNVMKNYTIQYNPKTRQIEYRDMYDFNEFEWGVPGKPFEIKGSIPLKRFGGSAKDDTKTTVLKRLRNKFTIAGDYGGGLFGGVGASSIITEQPEYINDTITKRYLIPVTQTFNDAFRNARNSGQNEFMFDGKLYNTNLGDNPNNNSAGAYVPVGKTTKYKTVAGRTFKKEVNNDKWVPVKNNNIIKQDKNINKKVDYTINGTFDNARPQYYAEKRLPIAGSQSIAEKAGLAKSGWSYADDKPISLNYMPNINLSIPDNYGKGSTPRRGETKAISSKSVATSKPLTKSADTKYGTPLAEKKESLYMTGIKNNVITPIRAGMEKIKSPYSTGGQKEAPWIPQFNTISTGDWIGLGSNLAGHIASYFANNSLLNKAPMPTKPVMTQAAKLKTRYNINPELSETRETELVNRAASRRNSQSSNTSLAREQRIANESRNARNKLYGQKENIETQLINQDRLNRQSIMARNVAAYNDWLNKTYVAKSNQMLSKQQNLMSLISGIPAAVGNFLGNIDSRKATNNTIKAIAAANPNVDGRMFGIGDYYSQKLSNGRVAIYDKNGKLKKYV